MGHIPPATLGGREDECVDGKTKSSSNKEDMIKVNVGSNNDMTCVGVEIERLSCAVCQIRSVGNYQ